MFREPINSLGGRTSGAHVFREPINIVGGRTSGAHVLREPINMLGGGAPQEGLGFSLASRGSFSACTGTPQKTLKTKKNLDNMCLRRRKT